MKTCTEKSLRNKQIHVHQMGAAEILPPISPSLARWANYTVQVTCIEPNNTQGGQEIAC